MSYGEFVFVAAIIVVVVYAITVIVAVVDLYSIIRSHKK